MGPMTTGAVWPFLLLSLVCSGLLVTCAFIFTNRDGNSGNNRHPMARLDDWRRWSRSRAKLGPLWLAAAVAVVGLVAVMTVTVALGELTKTTAVVGLDRPVYTFFYEHRAGWLSSFNSGLTRVGEYPAMTGMALAAAGVLVIRAQRLRLTGVVLLSAVLVPLLSNAGGLYNWVNVVALIFVAFTATWRRRPELISATLLLATMPVEKRLQAWVAGWVHADVPSLARAVGGVGNFPSGGCTRIVLITGLITYLMWTPASGRAARVGLASLTAVLSLVEGLTRLYLGKHWAVDVAGGWVFGAGLCGVFIAVDRALNGPLGTLPVARSLRVAPAIAIGGAARR